ncbi:MAG TPA: hypothetical protein VKT49_12610 [Bryobacteraceae bacterium]|nr:hypothetical protein [Bryobacteraceae bacterium]
MANEDCKTAKAEADRTVASSRLKNALQVFDDLVFPSGKTV